MGSLFVFLFGIIPALVSAHDRFCKNNDQCAAVSCPAWFYANTAAWTGTCVTGTNQSPIDIVTAAATPAVLGDIQFSHAYKHQIPGIYKNNAETNAAIFTPWNPTELTITGGPYGTNIYQLERVSFHYGCSDHQGSEHTINGKSYSMEMHIIHRNTAFATYTLAEAANNGLAILSILFEADGNNHEYDPLKDASKVMSCLVQPNSEYAGTLDLEDFIKTVDPGRYYTYLGSINGCTAVSVPSCYESVIYSVFPRIITINNDQMEEFRNLRRCDCGFMCNNYRPVQPLNARTVRYNKS